VASAKKTHKPTRQEQKDETREKVRVAALELFSDVGFDETTTKAVADRAGVATGTVFVHARDKVDLLCLVMHHELTEVVETAWATLPTKAPLLDQLLHVFRAVFIAYSKRPKLAPAFIKNLIGADGPNGLAVSANTFDFLGRIAGLVIQAQARGEIAKDVPPMLFAQNVFALYFLSLWSWVSGMTTVEMVIDPHLKSALELFMRGLDR
jgi:AcrR family transcriptional regulator